MTETQSLEPVPFRTISRPPEQSLGAHGSDDLAKRLRAIQSVTDAALAHLKLDSMLQQQLQRVRDALDVSAARVLLCTPQGTTLAVRAAIGLEDANEDDAPVPIGQGIAGWVAHHREAIIVDDVSRVHVVNPLLRRLSSAMVAPLLVEGRMIGVLKVGTTQPRAFSEADLALLQMVADRIALAIDRAQHVERLLEAEDRLDAGEQQYRSLFDNNPAAVCARDLDGNFSSLNPAAERISGYARDELLHHAFLPLVVEEERERTLGAFRTAVGGEPQQFRTAIMNKQGQRVILDVTVVPITVRGVVAGVYGIAEDVTGQQRHLDRQQLLLEQLRAERAQLEAVLQQLPAGVIIAEAPSGRVVLGNKQVKEILHHDLLESSSIDEYGSWKGLHADGTPMHPQEWPLARAIEAGEMVSGEELLYQCGDGVRRWLRVNAAPIRNPDGEITGGVVVFNDIDRQKRAADDMRFLAEVTSTLHSTLDYQHTLRQMARLAVPHFADWCVVDLVDADGRIQRQEAAHHDPEREAFVQEMQQRYPSRVEQVGHPVYEALRSGKSLLIPRIPEAMLEQLTQDEEHLRLIRMLGLVSAMIVPLRGRERTLGVITFVSAESQRHFAPEDLALAEEVARRSALAIENAELYEAASEASRAKSDFLAVMSHELRTPLAAIMGYAELLQMGIPSPVPEPALRQVERIDAAARHQLQLIEEILTFSRLRAGEEHATFGRADLASVIEDAVAFIRPAADKKGLPVRVELAPAPRPIITDANKVRQILLNLLFNAVQFTSMGEITIAQEFAGDEVRIRVGDTGIGIPRRFHREIFEPFWQVRQSTTREVGGTGLGLTVAYRTAHLLGGDISVESEPGHGSTFTLHLPAERHGSEGR
jgi:PAS domain S-box-containing protein